MEKKKVERERLEIRIPVGILEKIDKYQEENDIPTRTSAVLELIRKGLNAK